VGFKVQTFQDRLDAVGGFGPGFDLVRLVLCYEVMVWHCISLASGSITPGLASPFWLPFNLMVPMFFTLSGFLVTASALRLSRRDYLLNRAARILPALFGVVTFAMLIAGPLATNLPLGRYFTDPRFWAHASNLVALPNYWLPGVFETNPAPGGVNGSLWTVRWEIGCYMMMAIMVAAGLPRRAWAVPALALGWAVVNLFVDGMGITNLPGVAGKITRQIFGAGGMLFPYFLAGAAIYLFRNRIPWHGGLAALSIGIIVAGSLLLDGRQWQENPLKILTMILPSAYLVAWAGLKSLPVPRIYSGGDYSYGIYLWHFPILQLIQHYLHLDTWWQLLVFGFLPVTLAAAASWHLVEGPVLESRRRKARAARAAA
jgi:peptidoglycan/LPS O-acetylase OafA/YrhL